MSSGSEGSSRFGAGGGAAQDGTIAKPPYGALPANCPVPLSKWGNQAPVGTGWVVSTLSDTKATEKLRKKIPVFAVS
jgi:hypothetical protein